MAVLLCLFSGCGGRPSEPEPTAEPEPVQETPVSTPEPEPEPDLDYELSEEELQTLREELQADQEINPDIRCLIHFNSGLLHKPVAQSDNEDYYLYRDWQTHEYLSYGTITLDSRNHLEADDQNTILYGHYVYRIKSEDRTLAFSALEVFQEEAGYADNRYVTLVLPDEVRYYEVAAVFEAPLETIDGVQYPMYGIEYNLMDYDEEYMNLYRENIHRYEYYDTGVELSADDRFLTLQTCIENQHDFREVVLCVERDRQPFGG